MLLTCSKGSKYKSKGSRYEKAIDLTDIDIDNIETENDSIDNDIFDEIVSEIFNRKAKYGVTREQVESVSIDIMGREFLIDLKKKEDQKDFKLFRKLIGHLCIVNAQKDKEIQRLQREIELSDKKHKSRSSR
jgi:hypothetical protein